MRRFFVGLAISAMLGMIPGQARGNDRQISQTIVKSLQAEQKNKNLSGFNIDLEVDEGTVYLKGTVSSAEQEKLTLDIVRRIEGVTQVYNELEITSAAKSPVSEAAKPVEVEVEKVEVKVESKADAEVNAKAKVEAEAEAEAETEAEADVEATPKVTGILSSLRKSPANSNRRPASSSNQSVRAASLSDSDVGSRDLAERIINHLQQEKDSGQLQGFAIDVEVDKGVAWLKGTVASPEQQNRVLDVVRRISGVTQVVNGLTVTQPTHTPTDIAQQIVSRLQDKKASGELKNFSVDVEVDKGVVWLSGQTASDSQQQIILETARYIPGVTKVVNDLTVTAPVETKPQQATAKAALHDEESVSTKSPPQPLPHDDDEPIGSAVASGSVKGLSAPAAQQPMAAAPSPHVHTAPAPAPAPAPVPALQVVEQAVPNLQTIAPNRQKLQYVWVPASQMPGGQLPANLIPAQQTSARNTSANQILANQSLGNKTPTAAPQIPLPFAPANAASHINNIANYNNGVGGGQPVPINASVPGLGIAPARFDHPQMPQYSWPSYAPYPNYGAVTYPKQYSPTAWPYIGPFYPYPQVPLGWRKVELKWKDGWWQLDFKDRY